MADLFGDVPAPAPPPNPVIARSAATKQSPPDEPATFYQLAPTAIARGLGDLVTNLVRAQGSWTQKSAQLRAAMEGAAR